MDDDGFLSVDALVALTLTTLGLVIVLQAYSGVVALNRRALDLRSNMALALWVFETQWPQLAKPGVVSGEVPGGRFWRVVSRATKPDAEQGLCSVEIEVGVRGNAPYRLQTLDFCAVTS